VSATEKAARLLAEGRVTISCGVGGRLRAVVQGDHATYAVKLTRRGPSCSCPAWRRECSHALAVALVTEGRR
jgi:uncharacterized Zn finger protein